MIPANSPIATTGELGAAVQGCFKAPDHTAGSQVTVRFVLNGRGGLQGRPQIVSSTSVLSESDRRALDAAILDALRRCTPVNLSRAFAASIAGRALTLHLVGGPPLQGV